MRTDNAGPAPDARLADSRFSPTPFSLDELSEAFDVFEATVAEIAAEAAADRAAGPSAWTRFADLFTPDADYIEHALGTMHGREEIRPWIVKTMTRFPGDHMVAFPNLWKVFDAPTGRVIFEVDNPMCDPGDGSVITATNLSIVTYAGDGLWRCEEDIYNPMEFGAAAKRWCDRAHELGTLDDDAAQWASTFGRAFRG
ncbi:nuclear transport factor 2 family protein [Gordonia otitidis]|uniref:SnoaL-like domain-containing protein n=1 Tax=Gordonia otitidis (strain DSM 44809 / CCUG 52243 / JCM 12355 / NBRC 100426 / IFM 10032) TaxID=1108044 RepID=H5TNI8_GORO1|nr:nuclear transport factor 2 family protein [Gordonia otitidis]GAB35046.1 hypothetical protein GOOTI_134_00030 [Gordonia otitidis NBRC 100426]